MAAPTVYEDVAEGIQLEGVGQLFAEKKFWVAQRVPSRIRLLDEIKANGGQIVQLEKQADYLIADHFRRDCPPGSISYEFVDKSIKNGELQDPENHRAGPPLGEAREPGAINRTTKGGRTPYSAEEDRILYKWVRDCEASGGSASGNEIYKQLEAKYPQHPWQSWRDRYLRQLRNRPPSAFNIPDNAPPSPPSDQPNERMPPVSSTSKSTIESSRKTTQTQAVMEADKPVNSKAKDEYGTEQLADMFSAEDWEELYAFVDIIHDFTGQDTYDESWAGWAKRMKKQTAEQWKQYYEKVVRPQWLRDPAWKREQIKKKMESKYEGSDASQSQTSSQQEEQYSEAEKAEEVLAEEHQRLVEPEESTESDESNEPPLAASTQQRPSQAEDQRFEDLLEEELTDQNAAYTFYAREQKWTAWNAQLHLDYTALHKVLLSRWDQLSTKEKVPYFAMAAAQKKPTKNEVTKLASGLKLPSSSTAPHESPKELNAMYERALKRTFGGDAQNDAEEQEETHRAAKRRKSRSITPTVDDTAGVTNFVGTQEQPVEISSTESSSVDSQSDSVDQRLQTQIMEDILRSDPDAQREAAEEFVDEADVATESIESDDLPHMEQSPVAPEEYDAESVHDLPPNTPTPRASKQIRSNFDTQAILSSPSQEVLSRLPQRGEFTQNMRRLANPDRSSSPAKHPESDASTTQSLQEFRRSLNEEDMNQPAYSPIRPAVRPPSSSPAPSIASSTGSGDPDVPLDADEFDDFFNDLHEDGFSNDFIVKALRRTRCRPGLAMQVLEAWKEGKPLPNQRGIWSLEDDEAVESGDGLALAFLERKHTLDGWGGITERLVFLEARRSR